MPTQKHSCISSFIELVLIFAFAFAFFIFIRWFVAEPYVIPSGSMESTIEIGDQVLAEKVTINLGMGVEAGDIVVFENPDADSGHDILVKRVIATEGQTVDLQDGVVVVDGVPLDEPYARGQSFELVPAPGVSVSFPYTVPEGYVWMMGDNRENSADSRYFGAVPVDDLIGVVFFRYWPFDRIGAM